MAQLMYSPEEILEDRHTSFYCALLYWALQILHLFLQLEGLWQLCIEQVFEQDLNRCFSKEDIQIFFNVGQTTFAHNVSLCHILVIFTIFQTLHQQKDYDSLKAQMMLRNF